MSNVFEMQDVPKARGEMRLPESLADVVASDVPYMMDINQDPERAVRAYVPFWKLTIKDKGEVGKVLERCNAQISAWSVHKDMEATHVLMTGGKYYLPFGDAESSFLKACALAINTGHSKNLSFVEIRTAVSRLYVDCDYEQLAALTALYLEAAAYVIGQTVRSFFPSRAGDDEFFACIVCSTRCKDVVKDGVKLVKTGVHMTWTNIYVTCEQALDIRESVVAALASTFGKRIEPANDWHDVVDASVYGLPGGKGGSLRMVGSRKTDDCPECKRKGKVKAAAAEGGGTGGANAMVTCGTCFGRGRVDAGRPYMPLLVLCKDGRRDVVKEAEYLNDMHKVMLDTKIRSPLEEPTEGYVLPAGAPAYVAPRKKEGARLNPKIPAEDREPSAKDALQRSDPAYDIIQSFLRAHMGDVESIHSTKKTYEDILVAELKTNARRSLFLVHVRGTNSRFCGNINREHKSNRIYFVVTPEGCIQRCHDASETKTADMRFDLCSAYKSTPVPLPPAVLAALFPDEAKRKTATGMPIGSGGMPFGTTTPGAAGAHDQFNATSLRLQNNKLAMLYALGDRLAMEQFQVSWTPTLKLRGAARLVHVADAVIRATAMDKLRRPESAQYAEIDPSALGVNGVSALQALGYKPRQDTAADPTQEAVAETPRRSIGAMEVDLFRYVDKVYETRAHLPPERVAASLGAPGCMQLQLGVTPTFVPSTADASGGCGGTKRTRDVILDEDGSEVIEFHTPDAQCQHQKKKRKTKAEKFVDGLRQIS